MTLAGTLWPYLVIAFAGWLATDMWRLIGVAVSTRVKETSEVFVWVKAVATALVAGIIARLILFPAEPLAGLPLVLRIAAVAIGFSAYRLGGRSVFLGVFAAELALIGAGWALDVPALRNQAPP